MIFFDDAWKKYKFFVVTSILLACGAVTLYFSSILLKSSADRKPAYLSGHGKNPLVVLDFKFAGYNGEVKIISIKAAKHTIEKKKIGFISLGADYIAHYKNAVIDIHGKYVEDTNSNKKDGQIAPYRFNAIFSKDVLPILSQKDVSALIFEPVKIYFFNKKQLLTQVQANSATIKSLDGRIFLKGQISAKSASRILMAERLTLNSNNGLMETNGNFILKTPEKQITGNKLTSDIGLNILRVQ